MIGKQWHTIKDKKRRRRLDNEDDLVRAEIRAALQQKIPVIPVTVQNAAMPLAEDLPDDIRRLARRNGIDLSATRWATDVERLIKELDRVMKLVQPALSKLLTGRASSCAPSAGRLASVLRASRTPSVYEGVPLLHRRGSRRLRAGDDCASTASILQSKFVRHASRRHRDGMRQELHRPYFGRPTSIVPPTEGRQEGPGLDGSRSRSSRQRAHWWILVMSLRHSCNLSICESNGGARRFRSSV